MVTDPIADMLTRLRNALKAGHARVEVPYSRVKEQIAAVLKREGFVGDFRVMKNHVKVGQVLEVKLKYDARGRGVIVELKRLSKPGLRKYVGKKDLKPHYAGHGIVILSTSKGIMTGREARAEGVGGEPLCSVW